MRHLFIVNVALVIVCVSIPVYAGEYHVGGNTLACSECHSMHFSQDGASPTEKADKGPYLLLGSDNKLVLTDPNVIARISTETCLMCHESGNGGAPKVVDPASTSAAGCIDREWEISGMDFGHTLGVKDTPEDPDWNRDPLSCVSCHDPHGNTNYRNLREDPGENGNTITVSYAKGEIVIDEVVQIRNNDLDGSDLYDEDNIAYIRNDVEKKDGLSVWCTGCHIKYLAYCSTCIDSGGSSEGHKDRTVGTEWRRHPNALIDMRQVKDNGHIDNEYWLQLAEDKRPPYVTYGDTSPNGDGGPFCGSCHKAHGKSQAYKEPERELAKTYGLLFMEENSSNKYLLAGTCQACHQKKGHGDPQLLVCRECDSDDDTQENRYSKDEYGWKAGECEQCHRQHAKGDSPNDYLLFAENNNAICFSNGCHGGKPDTYPSQETDRVPAGLFAGYFEKYGNYDGNVKRATTRNNRARWPGKDVYENSLYSPHYNDSDNLNDPDMPLKDKDAKGLCLNCHNPHAVIGPDADPNIPFDLLRDTYLNTGSSSDDAEKNYKLCFNCHENIKEYYTITSSEYDPNSSGHQIRMNSSLASEWPDYISRGDKLSCSNCHNPHGSNRNNKYLLSDQREGWYNLSDTLANAEECRRFCFGCHVPSDGNPDDAHTVEGIKMQKLPEFGAHKASSPQSCYQCHGKDYSRTTSYNVHHPQSIIGGPRCLECHNPDDENVMSPITEKVHLTHFDSEGAGPGIDISDEENEVGRGCLICHHFKNYHIKEFKKSNTNDDPVELEETNVCDTCHSPGPAEMWNDDDNPFLLVKASWSWDNTDQNQNGVYDDNGQLKEGKEKWCIGCHDSYSDAANSKFDGSGIKAPNIGGDNITYGYYISGHKIKCTYCHDRTKKHIDHEHRSYSSSKDNYVFAYRLKDLAGKASMIIPRPIHNLLQNIQDFALCWSCHNKYYLLGTPNLGGDWKQNPVRTNFYEQSKGRNSHTFHLGIDNIHWDSDWDGTADSRESCTACHNVHGSPTPAMIRHGELISTPGTTNKVPSLNFSYLTLSDKVSSATFHPVLEAGMYSIYAWWAAGSNRATNAPYTIHYYDIESSSYKDFTICVDQRTNGGQWNCLGEYFLTAGSYVMLSNQNVDGYVIADAVRFSKDEVNIDIDNLNKEYVTYFDQWPMGQDPIDPWEGTIQYHAKPGPVPSPDTTFFQSIGGVMQIKGRRVKHNRVCDACHDGDDDDEYYVREEKAPIPAQLTLIDPKADPGEIYLPKEGDQNEEVVFSVFVYFSDSTNIKNVGIDLSSIGMGTSQEMNNEGDNIYFYRTSIGYDSNLSEGPKEFAIIAEAEISHDGLLKESIKSHVSGYFMIKTSPRFIRFEAIPDSITLPPTDSGTESLVFRAEIEVDPRHSIDAVFLNLLPINGQEQQLMNDHGDNRYYYEASVGLDVGSGERIIVVTARENTGAEANTQCEIFFYHPDDVIVDNLDVSSNWTFTSNTEDTWKGSAQYHAAGEGFNTFTFVSQIKQSGNYNIYAWWKEGNNRAIDAPYTIYFKGGIASEIIPVNQQKNGGRWNFLGNYYFTAGANNQAVVLSDKVSVIPNITEGYVIADAVFFAKGELPAGHFPVVVDNEDAMFFGYWPLGTTNPKVQFHKVSDPEAQVIWKPNIPQSGKYNVYARWVEGTNRSEDAHYIVYYCSDEDCPDKDHCNCGKEDLISEEIFVNQQISCYENNENGFLLKSSIALPQGIVGYVVLTAETEKACTECYVIADEIFWQPDTSGPIQ
ncbi:MAG: hypothetical protein ACMUJM_20800 [bacterium]